MPVQSLKAHYDGTAVQLDEPCDLPANTPLMVVVLGHEEPFQAERNAWFGLARQSLARAYGDDEPDYTENDLVP